jgi:pyruvate dehydrogenase E1 component alpha subunit
MLLVWTIGETRNRILKEGRIQVNAHWGTGQEAVSVGVTGPLRQDDILFGMNRGVGEYIGKGMSPKDIWREYLGKKTGPCKGKGTQHLVDRKNNIPGLAACLGSDFSMSVGTALASKMRDMDQVTLFFVGEGVCNEGYANPSMCMAALWNLPLVFAVRTNQFCEMGYMSEHFPLRT